MESSNIINIGIIYINFYLVYGYLFNFSVGEVCECVRLCEARGKLRELVSACGLKKKKGDALGLLMGCGFFRNSRNTFRFLPLSVLLACVFVNQRHYEV